MSNKQRAKKLNILFVLIFFIKSFNQQMFPVEENDNFENKSLFGKFINKYRKKYTNLREKVYRYKIFLRNLLFIRRREENLD